MTCAWYALRLKNDSLKKNNNNTQTETITTFYPRAPGGVFGKENKNIIHVGHASAGSRTDGQHTHTHNMCVYGPYIPIHEYTCGVCADTHVDRRNYSDL